MQFLDKCEKIIFIKFGKMYLFNKGDTIYARTLKYNLFTKRISFMQESLGGASSIPWQLFHIFPKIVYANSVK